MTEAGATDWNSYYQRPYKTASLTRRYTASVLASLIRQAGGEGADILELGGANSCFIDRIMRDVRPSRYDVVDSNRLGLDLLTARYRSDGRVTAIQSDVLSLSSLTPRYQVVYSVGLIEHFDRERTALAIDAHFRALRPGGTAIVTFPTPTLLYRSVRRIAEITGNWIFHDERPIDLPEFLETAGKRGEMTYARILWPLILTQYCVAIRTG